MSGNAFRVLLCVFLSIALTACGGGGGGSGSNTQPDTDKDGIVDAQDAFPNDPKEWLDTDKDGVGDNSDAFPNDSKETKDTDKDGVGDNADAFPNDPAETVDTDKDGIGDNADTTPLGQAIPGWSTFQGSAKHLGWVDISLATTNFKERWNKPLLMANLQQGAAGDGYIFFNNGGVLYALDARTGETLWTRNLVKSNQSFNAYNPPAYSDGLVYVQTGTYNSVLQAFNALDGVLVFEVSVPDAHGQGFAPSIVDGTVYVMNEYYGTVYAFDAKTGSQKWLKSLYIYDYAATLAISDTHAFIYSSSYSPRLIALNRLTGSVEFEIADSSYTPTSVGGNLVSVVAGDIVLGNYRGRLAAFHLSGKQLMWSVTANFTGKPVVKDNRLYVINSGALEVRDLTTGVLLSTITGTQPFAGNPLLTNNLVFVQDGQNSYAYTLETGALAWTLASEAGDMMLAEGALLVFAANGVVAIDVEGDIDADGLPDWWEKRYKKNIDPNADADNDGLTGLEEFNHSTNPLVADADGDKLLDGEEVAYKTSPFKADTDGDGLDDYLEVKTYRTDPTSVDSDNDTLRDGEEVAAGLNPLDATDALADADNDGFSNLHEVRANTGINDAASKPQLTEWSIHSGNQGRSSYAPQLLNQNHFGERWAISSPMYLGYPVTAAGKIILRAGSTQLLALDSGTGEESWRQDIPSGTTPLNSQDGKLWYLTGNSGGAFNLESLSATDGSKLSSKQLGSSDYFYATAPLLQDGKVYHIDSGYKFKAYTQSNGSPLWTSVSANQYLSNERHHLLSADQLIGVSDSALTIFSPTTGALVKTISVNSYINNAILGSKGNVIVDTGSTLMSITTADGVTQWINSDCPAARIAAGNGSVYVLTQSKLCVFDQHNGKLVWALDLQGNYWNLSNIVLTASHLFYSNGESTYAIDLGQRTVGWTLQKGASELLMGADGTLYLLANYRVIAVDTEGDIDADGLPQWWERRHGGDLVANADPDGDGLTNLEEYAEKTNPLVADTDGDTLSDGVEVKTTKTNPLVADTDKDGLSDAAEVNTHNSDPLVVDSDGDGIDDGREVSAGLDPDDSDDADADNDNDGFTNRDEIMSGTDLANAASKPQVTDWAMQQANAAHNGFQPYRLDSDNFTLRWSKTFNQAFNPLVTGDKQVFVIPNTAYSDQSSLIALNPVDGKEHWQKPLGQSYNYVKSAAYSEGKVLVNQYYPAGIRAFDSHTGTMLFQNEFTTGATELPPVIVGTTAYYNLGSYGIQAKDLANGATLWTKGMANNVNLAGNDQYIFYSYDANIFALERTSGAQAFTIRTQSTQNSGLILGKHNNLIGRQSSLGLTSIDIATGQTNWSIPFNSYSNSLPAVGNGQVYYLGDNGIYSADEISGERRWFWYTANDSISSNIVVTLSHIFVASNSKTYALSAKTGELEWTYNTGGSLALGADGALYIQSGRYLVAISLEGDSDGDDIPDWWERHYGLDPKDASDAALDLDSDGLTNLEEFTLGSYADTADSDADGLSDLDETNIHHTDPTSRDSDNDGMSDGWEVDQNLDPLDPLDRDLDSDNDQVPNFFEFLSGTDPHDALSAPAFFSAGTYSFEDAQLPAGWMLSAETTDVSIGNNASHGSKALQARQQADIGFFGFFAASDLSLDIKSGCDSSYTVSIYVDDELMATGSATSNWSTLKTVIPLGNHKVSIRTNSYSCAILIDNVVIAAAASNVDMGVQFVGLYDNFLHFVNASGELVRSMYARTPAKNVTPRNLATLDNEKVAVVFSGDTRHLGLLDLQTLNWRYFDIPDQLGDYYYGGVGIAAKGNYAYLTTYNPATGGGVIARINLTNGTITRFGSHHYNTIALGRDGAIHAHANGVVYKYDSASLALLSQTNVINANQILLDSNDRLVVANSNEVVRYNAQRLVEARLQQQWINGIAVNERNELIVSSDTVINWYSSDWQRNRKLGVRATFISSFPQPDTDTDGLPDWWELAYGLDPLDAADATSDDDADGLNALQEFAADTNPGVDDTDGDLLLDGDEVNDFHTNPNLVDTDGDTLTDADEVLNHQTNPLLADTDGDLVPDALELNQFGTDPKDATKKPATYENFLESFENAVVGWLRPVAGANAGWSVASDTASLGSKSLRSENLSSYDQTAQVEWAGLYNQSTLSFDMKSSSSYCCFISVYVDNQLQSSFYTNEQWQTWSVGMSPGFHTVRFVYRKTTSSPNMNVWLDNVRVQ